MKTNTKRLLCCFLSFLLLICTVPITAVTANAETAVSYLDKNGDEQQCTEYKVITSQTELSEGWYVVNSDVTISGRITVSGEVHLILADGNTLTANGGINVAEGNSFTIYAQSTGDTMGKLQASAFAGAGIGGGDEGAGGTVAINGGTVKATGGTYGAGIGGGIAGAGAMVNINGGTVEATAGTNCDNAIGAGYASTNNGKLAVSPIDNSAIYVKAGGAEGNADSINGSPFATGTEIIDSVAGNKYVKIQVPVKYLDENGDEKQCTEYTAITDQTTLSNGWYVVNSDVTISNRITVSGEVHLILADGKTLTANGGINVSENNAFTVYAQSTGDTMGKLTAKGPVGAGIGGNNNQSCGKVTINGGTVNATGGSFGAGIGGGFTGKGATVTINGGTVTATGGDHGAGIGGGNEGAGGTVTVTGGTVNATGGEYAAGIGGGFVGAGATVTINGGTVKATGGDFAAGIGGGANGAGATVTITGGTVDAKGGDNGAGIGGGDTGAGGTVTITGGTVKATGGDRGAGIGGGYKGAGATVTISGGTVEATAGENCDNAIGAGYASTSNGKLTVSPIANSAIYVKAGDAEGSAGSIDGSPFMTGTEITDSVAGNKYVKTVEKTFVKYIDADGAEQQCKKYTELTDQTELSDGWYVVNSDVTIGSRITVSGEVHLILADGITLNAESGINVAKDNSFTVYAQSTGDTAGKLTAKGIEYDAGIGGGERGNGGTFTINGGTVTATGGTRGAGIGGGEAGAGATVTIKGGTVNATGGNNGAGIGGGEAGAGGTVTINGGTVNATGGNNGAGIGGGYYNTGGTVTVNGGTVTAVGGGGGAGIGGGYARAGGTVTINGGTVEATAGANCDNAIGAGYNSTRNGTLTVSPIANSAIYVKAGDTEGSAESIDGSPFMTEKDIINSVAGKKYVKTCSASIPAYTVTIPETVQLDDSAEISAENVSLPDGFSLCVKLTDASNFKVKSDKGAELSYTITKDGTPITVDAIVLSVPGGSDAGAATLVFSKPENPVYAGKYKGTLTFLIKIE